MPFVFLFASIFCAVLGQLLLKATVMKLDGVDFASGSFLPHLIKLLTSPLFYLAMCVYFSSMILYLIALSKLELSLAYPMVAVNYAIILVCGKLFFNEKVTALRWIGVAFIIAGVVLVSRS
jgi:multidrug transporter EmrE-like cation transporter